MPETPRPIAPTATIRFDAKTHSEASDDLGKLRDLDEMAGASRQGLEHYRNEEFLDALHLECAYCHRTLSADAPHRTCPDPDCGKVLYPRYDLQGAGG